MKTRKIILNDDGRAMTKKQAEKVASAYLILEATTIWASGKEDNLAAIELITPVESDGDVTLNDLFSLINS